MQPRSMTIFFSITSPFIVDNPVIVLHMCISNDYTEKMYK